MRPSRVDRARRLYHCIITIVHVRARVRAARSSQSQPAVRPNREPLARRDRGERAAPWCGAPFGTAPRRRAAREPGYGRASLSRPGERRVRRNAPGRGDVRARGAARRPVAGRVTVLGDAIPDAAPRVLARVGYVPEQPHLDPTLTVRETLRFQAAFYPNWDWPCAERLLRQFELDSGTTFGRLSKGQKGKLMTLLALAQRPDLLVLDEPTDGLDPVVRRDVLSALLDYVSHRQATVFISSHLVHELERICDWIGVMDNCRLITEVPMARFKNGIKRLRVAGP